jgi:hypothetical protein
MFKLSADPWLELGKLAFYSTRALLLLGCPMSKSAGKGWMFLETLKGRVNYV